MIAGKYALRNGKIIPVKNFSIPPNDLGFLRSFSVFDVMEAQGNAVFCEKEHFGRLFKGLKDAAINTDVPYIKNLPFLLKKLLAKNNLGHSYLRVSITGGLTKDGFNPTAPPQCYAFCFKHKHNPALSGGLKLFTQKFHRDYPLIKKPGDYFGAEIFIKKRKKYDDVLYIGKNNEILETSRRNIFVVAQNGGLKTPKNNILPGVTRAVILKLFPKIKETTIYLDDLLSAKEIFITATVSGIVSVVQVNNKKFPAGKITQKIKNLFLEYKKEYFTQT